MYSEAGIIHEEERQQATQQAQKHQLAGEDSISEATKRRNKARRRSPNAAVRVCSKVKLGSGTNLLGIFISRLGTPGLTLGLWFDLQANTISQ